MSGTPLRAQQLDSLPTLAVLPFQNGSGADVVSLRPLGRGIADILTTELSKDQRIRVVDRVDLRSLLQEQNLRDIVSMDEATAVHAGRLLGARSLMTGSYVTDSSRMLSIAVKVLDTESGRVLWSHRSDGALDDMLTLITRLATIVRVELDLPTISAQADRERGERLRSRPRVPFEAVMIYSRALSAEDAGDRVRAIELLQSAISRFPDFADAQTALDRLLANPRR